MKGNYDAKHNGWISSEEVEARKNLMKKWKKKKQNSFGKIQVLKK